MKKLLKFAGYTYLSMLLIGAFVHLPSFSLSPDSRRIPARPEARVDDGWSTIDSRSAGSAGFKILLVARPWIRSQPGYARCWFENSRVEVNRDLGRIRVTCRVLRDNQADKKAIVIFGLDGRVDESRSWIR